MATRKTTPDILGDILGGKSDPIDHLEIRQIRRDGGTQMRAAINAETVNEYAEVMEGSNGWGSFPPATVYYDGAVYWLADGFHRVAALELLSCKRALGFEAPCVVMAGTRRDAILHAVGANSAHGLRRTNSDKRRAVYHLLSDPEWRQWSDGEIARRTGTSQPFVSAMRRKWDAIEAGGGQIVSLAEEAVSTQNGFESMPDPKVRIASNGRAIKTAAIGKKAGNTPQLPRVVYADTVEGLQPAEEIAPAPVSAGAAIATVAEAPRVPLYKPLVVYSTMPPAPQEEAIVVAPELEERNRRRREEAQAMINLYRAALDTEVRYEELTGDFMAWLGLSQNLTKMIQGLERLVEALA